MAQATALVLRNAFGGTNLEIEGSMISGLNHITLSVSDLERSFIFYTEIVGLKPVARWYKGAYLLAGETWICLSLDPGTRKGPLTEYSHLALSVEQVTFKGFIDALLRAGAIEWQANRSHGDSFYFLDPDGHKLEIHVSDLASRLKTLRLVPPQGLVLYR